MPEYLAQSKPKRVLKHQSFRMQDLVSSFEDKVLVRREKIVDEHIKNSYDRAFSYIMMNALQLLPSTKTEVSKDICLHRSDHS